MFLLFFAILSTVTVIAIIWFISIFVNLYTDTETAVANDKVIFPTVIDNDFKPLRVNENSKTHSTERKVAVENEKTVKG